MTRIVFWLGNSSRIIFSTAWKSCLSQKSIQPENNVRDSCQKERQHQIKVWPSELVPLFKPFLFRVLKHFSNRRSKLPATDIWAARFFPFFSPNFQSLQDFKHVLYTNNTRALCYSIFLFVGVVFKPYHGSFWDFHRSQASRGGSGVERQWEYPSLPPAGKNSNNRRGREGSLTLYDNCPISGSSGRGKSA